MLYLTGYLFIVNRAPNPITNTLNFFNNMLVIELLCLANDVLQLQGATSNLTSSLPLEGGEACHSLSSLLPI